MSNPFLGEIRPWACNFAPRGWALCQGQLLAISQSTALFSLLGTTYGGNGTTTFALPDLRSRVPMKYGTDPAGNSYVIGQDAGEETITLLGTQMPIHTHNVFGTTANAGKSSPVAGFALGTAPQGDKFYAPGASANQPINAATASTYAGGGQAHTNIQPYLAINWCIATSGIFPSRN